LSIDTRANVERYVNAAEAERGRTAAASALISKATGTDVAAFRLPM
jgi:hypothetical protein